MIDPASIRFGEKIGNFIATRVANDDMIYFRLGSVDEPLRSPFGVSEPIGGTITDRKTLDLEIDAELAGQIRAIDAAVVTDAIKRPTEYFGKKLNEAAVLAMHQPLVTIKEGYAPTVRTKVKLNRGATVVRVFTGENKYRRGTLDDVRKGCKVVAQVNMSSVWFASKLFGVSLSVDLLIVWPATDVQESTGFPGLEGFKEE